MELEQLPNLPPRGKRRILAICGGGYAGLFAAEILRRLEDETGQPINQTFDLIAGTSVGGLLALALAKGTKATNASRLIENLGPSLFAGKSFGFWHAKHDTQDLVTATKREFLKKTLSDLNVKIIVPALDITNGQTIIFSNGPESSNISTAIVDVALATSAAPRYLKPHSTDKRIFADGGLVANSPEAVAVTMAVGRWGWSASDCEMLVVGSTQRCSRVPGSLAGAGWGIFHWMRKSRLLNSTFQAQMSLASQMSGALLGQENVHRIDVELSAAEEKIIDLDKATSKATEALKTLASGQFAQFARRDVNFVDSLRRRR